MMSVSWMTRRCLLGIAWKATRATARAAAASEDSSAARIAVGVEREWDRRVRAGGRDRSGWVDEHELSALQDGEQRPESLFDAVASRGRCREHGDDVVAVDFGEGVDPAGGPVSGDRCDCCDVESGGLRIARVAAWGLSAAVDHHVEPDAQLVGHWFGQPAGVVVEVSLDRGEPVVVQQPGSGEHVEGGDDTDVGLQGGEGDHGGCVDRAARCVLQGFDEPQRAAHVVGLLAAPPVFDGVVAHDLIAERHQLAVGAAGSGCDHDRVGTYVEQCELFPRDRRVGEVVADRRDTWQRPAPLDGGGCVRCAAVRCLAQGLGVREEQLLAEPGRIGEVDLAAGLLTNTGGLETQSAATSLADHAVTAAAGAGAVRVVAVPPSTRPADATGRGGSHPTRGNQRRTRFGPGLEGGRRCTDRCCSSGQSRMPGIGAG